MLHGLQNNWNKVIWSDETRISAFGSDGIRYVRQRPGEDCLPECLTSTMKHPLSVMIWDCMSRKGVGRIQVLEGTVNASRYIKEVLEPKMLPSTRDLFGGCGDYIFQQDAAPCHTARVCTKWFQEHSVQLLTWPGNSPDLNTIVQFKVLIELCLKYIYIYIYLVCRSVRT